MIKSMTAFSSVEKTEHGYTVTAEIRTYNSRYLDIALRIPHTYIRLEDRIKSLVSGRLARGRIEIHVQIRDVSEPDYIVEIDTPKMKALQAAVSQLKATHDIPGELPLEYLLGAGGVIRLVESEKDIEACWSVIETCLAHALDDLDTMRNREGDAISRDFEKRLNFIEQSLIQIKTASTGLPLLYQERLKDRIASLTNGMVEVDPARIAQEAAFHADRSDISEEIVRADSHLKQFRSIMASEEAGGRKLNFLLQEFNREFNTMGSKAGIADLSHIIVSVKSELEKIREQVQNVE
jgi:uncharacterized protein (TIGR00255 family)